MANRSEMVDIAIDLVNELSPGDTPLAIHMRIILLEFARKLATKVDNLEQNKLTPRGCPGCGIELE